MYVYTIGFGDHVCLVTEVSIEEEERQERRTLYLLIKPLNVMVNVVPVYPFLHTCSSEKRHCVSVRKQCPEQALHLLTFGDFGGFRLKPVPETYSRISVYLESR
jgi:hypothetical protein